MHRGDRSQDKVADKIIETSEKSKISHILLPTRPKQREGTFPEQGVLQEMSITQIRRAEAVEGATKYSQRRIYIEQTTKRKNKGILN